MDLTKIDCDEKIKPCSEIMIDIPPLVKSVQWRIQIRIDRRKSNPFRRNGLMHLEYHHRGSKKEKGEYFK